MMTQTRYAFMAAVAAALVTACTSTSKTTDSTNATGGAPATGGVAENATGGSGAGGNLGTGGTTPTGGSTISASGTGGTAGKIGSSGGAAAGATGLGGGGAAAGGRTGAGGGVTGGSVGSGGVATGGRVGSGGAATGGTSNVGGSASGGTGRGGSATGGSVGTGGNTGPTSCPSGGWAPGKQTVKTQWGGVDRQYVVYIPKSYTATAPVPLMMVIHGAHNTPGLVESWSQMDPVSDQNGFIIVYPAGLDCWNVGGLILPGCTAADDDVGFLNNVITEVESHACIDTKRVYVTGISNGSMMAQYMGCHFANTFAAAGGVAAGGGCSPSRPLPIFYVLGTADQTVGWDNGANALSWAKRDGCNTTPVTVYTQGATTCIAYQGCSAGVEVEFCSVTGMQHCWPDNCYLGAVDFKASPAMWQFFSRFTLP